MESEPAVSEGGDNGWSGLTRALDPRQSKLNLMLLFVPLAIYARMVEIPPSLSVGMVLTLVYVLLWIPVGNGWFERAGGYSLEGLLKRLSS